MYGDAEIEFQKKSQKQRRKQIEIENKQKDQALLNQVNNSQPKHLNAEDNLFEYNQQISLSSKDFYDSLKKYELRMLNDLNILDKQSKYLKNKHENNGIFSSHLPSHQKNISHQTKNNLRDNMSKDILKYERILQEKKVPRKVKSPDCKIPKDNKILEPNYEDESITRKNSDFTENEQNSNKNLKYILQKPSTLNNGKVSEAHRSNQNRNQRIPTSKDARPNRMDINISKEVSTNSYGTDDYMNNQDLDKFENVKKSNFMNNKRSNNTKSPIHKQGKTITIKNLELDDKISGKSPAQRDTIFTQSNKRKNGNNKKDNLPELLFDVEQIVGPANGSPSSGGNFPKVTCKAFIMMDTKKKEIIWGKNIINKREVASLTKTMTCLVALNFIQTNNIDIENVYYYVSEEAGNTRGTTARLRPYDFVCQKDLLYGLMLPSGNDAAVTLAENVGTHMYLSSYEYKVKKRQPFYDDSRDEKLLNPEKLFYEEMNKFAEKIGMENTVYANPHGLANTENFSCALDQAKISLFAMNDKLFREVVKTKTYTGLVERDHKECDVTWENTNKLLDRGYKGIKTGITSVAGPCLSSYFENDRIGIICIVLGCKVLADRFNDCDSQTQWAVRNYSYIMQIPMHLREKDPRTVF